MDSQLFVKQFGSFIELEDINLIFLILKKVGLRDVLASGLLLSKAFKASIETHFRVGYLLNAKEYYTTVYNYDNGHVYGLELKWGVLLVFDNLTTKNPAEFSVQVKENIGFPTGFIANDTFIFFDEEDDIIHAYDVKTGQKKFRFENHLIKNVDHIFWNKEREEIAVIYILGDLIGEGWSSFGIFFINLNGEVAKLYSLDSDDTWLPLGKFNPLASVGDSLYIHVNVKGKNKLMSFNVRSKVISKIDLDKTHLPVGIEFYDSYNLVVTLAWKTEEYNYLFYRKDWSLLSKYSFSLNKMPWKAQKDPIGDYRDFVISDKMGDFFLFTSEGTVVKQTLVFQTPESKVKSRLLEAFEQMPVKEQKIASKLIFEKLTQ